MAKVIKYCLVISAILWLRDIIIKRSLFLSDFNHGFNNTFRNLESRSPRKDEIFFFFHLKLKAFRLQSEEKGLKIWILFTLLIIFFLQMLWWCDTLVWLADSQVGWTWLKGVGKLIPSLPSHSRCREIPAGCAKADLVQQAEPQIALIHPSVPLPWTSPGRESYAKCIIL